MDPRKLGGDARKLPLLSSKRSEKSMDGKEKCIHGNEKGMGCCGYDELAVKPATTRPITFGTSVPKAKPPEEAKMGERPRIQARALPQPDIQLPSAPQGIPVQAAAGGRIPDGSASIGANVRSIFDAPRAPQQPNMGRAAPAPQRPRVMAMALGQEAAPEAPAPTPPPPAPPSPPQVEAILKREAPPEGITKSEANDLALALNPALENSALALAEGEQCFGVDNSSLTKATGLRDGLVKFAKTAPDNARLQIEPKDITLIEQVLDCSSIYENKKKADSAKTIAFVAGGLLVGAVVLLVVSS
jgi:hypothetical protein